MAAKNTATNKVGVLHLLGAPDDTIGERTEHNKAGQSMRVQLVQDLTKEMRDNIQHGRAQAVLGSNPVCCICDGHNLGHSWLTMFASI